MNNRQQKRNQRTELLEQLFNLEAANCFTCPVKEKIKNKLPDRVCRGCPAFKKISSIGKQLDNLSNHKKDMTAPETLTMKTYRELRDKEWTKRQIRMHYNLTVNDFTYFLEMNKEYGKPFEEPRQAHNVGKSKLNLTVEEYKTMKSVPMTDREILERYNVEPGVLIRWKRANGIEIKKRAVRTK